MQADDPDFQTVINRLENKGWDHNMKILKLNEVRNLRKKTGDKIKDSMVLGYNNDLVIDSSHLIGVEVIKNFLKKRKERIERRKALKDELKSMILNESSDRKRIKFMNSHNNLEYRSANFLMN